MEVKGPESCTSPNCKKPCTSRKVKKQAKKKRGEKKHLREAGAPAKENPPAVLKLTSGLKPGPMASSL